MAVKMIVLIVSVLSLMCITVSGKAIESEEAVRAPRALHQFTEETDAGTWLDKGQAILKRQLDKRPDVRKARNVILFLGDGMSVATVSAARIFLGQKLGASGEGGKLFFEEFPFTGLSKTYCVDKQVADSACSATAYLGGVKANYGTIGVTAAVKRLDCNASANKGNHVPSISVWAQKAGKSTGVVTTTRVTHASPAGTYAHTSERDWEADADILKAGADPLQCRDIAYQLVNTEPGMNHKVILGGGRKNFLPKTVMDEDNLPGVREDGLDLIKSWKQEKTNRGASSTYITNRDDLLSLSEVDYLLGLFDSDHMQYHLDADPKTEPTLAEMTKAAIKQLSTNKNGYFLFVEGGRIDHAHHSNLAHKALDETVEFAEAVKVAYSMVPPDTLIVVTADHAHTMSFAGYPTRGTDILGFGGLGLDNLPYSTLAYANGPGYRAEPDGRYNMTNDDRHAANYTFPSPVPLKDETHGGDDVQVFANGPWSHLFTGAYEQNAIPHILAYASCIGTGLTACS